MLKALVKVVEQQVPHQYGVQDNGRIISNFALYI